MPVAVSSYKLPVPDLPMVRNRHALKGVPGPVTLFRLIRASGGDGTHLNGHSCKPQHSDDPAGSRGEAKIGIPTRRRRTMAGIHALTKKRK
jgi:hypothetical protein